MTEPTIAEKTVFDQTVQDEILRKSQPIIGAIQRMNVVHPAASYRIIVDVQQGVPRKVDINLPLARSRRGQFSGNNKQEDVEHHE